MTVTEILQFAGYPENFVILDFETFFDKDYSIAKMSTWAYVTDDRFETIGCGFKFSCADPADPYPPYFVWADDLQHFFEGNQKCYGPHLENITVVIQNVQFDALVLQEHYKIIPKYMIDLKHLDAHFDSRRSHKLKDMAKREKLPLKGGTMQFSGVPFNGTTNRDWFDKMQEYCINDVEDEYALFEKLLPYLTEPEIELKIARHTIDLYLKPRLSFDFELADELVEGMQKYITEASEKVGLSTKELSGNLSFVKALQAVLPEGEVVPTKSAKRPSAKMTALLGQPGIGPALAKTDDGCKLLLAHSKDEVRKLMEARQAVKSWPLHIKRVLAMQTLADVCNGKLPVPLNYYGCHTGRWSGGGGINLLNLGGKGRAGQGTHPLISKMRELLYV